MAGDVALPPFEPRKGVQIETDPKATKVVSATQDDESAIESLISSLEVGLSKSATCLCQSVAKSSCMVSLSLGHFDMQGLVDTMAQYCAGCAVGSSLGLQVAPCAV